MVCAASIPSPKISNCILSIPAIQAVPPDLSVSTVLEDPEGQVWIGTEHKGRSIC